jgi:hypothetical protein
VEWVKPLRIFQNFLAILASGRFNHADYAWLHLHSRYLAPLALLHYVAVGERNGARPTPFFDPEFFARHVGARPGGGALFGQFLRAPRGAPACAEFDEAWYCQMIPEARGDPHSPWADAQRRVLRDLRDPSPSFSTAFVMTAFGAKPKRLGRTLLKLFERRRVCAGSLPLNAAELAENQRRFRDKIALEILRESPKRHDALVFIQTNGGHPAALQVEARPYDLLLNFYEPPPSGDWPAEFIYSQRGTKATAIDVLLRQRPEILTQYDYVMFLDDDIELTPDQIGELFNFMRRKGLDLAQPALTPDSYATLPLFYRKQSREGFRLVTFVEIMAPAFSRRALIANRENFGANISGFGIDVLIGDATRKAFGATVAVIDVVVARHLREIDLTGGAYYRFLAAEDIDPMVEMWTLEAERGLLHDPREI